MITTINIRYNMDTVTGYQNNDEDEDDQEDD